MGNNEEMAFNYTEVIVYRSFTRRRGVLQKIPLVKGTVHGNKKPFGTKIKVNTCTNFVLGRLKKMEKSGFCNFTYVIVAVYFTTFESHIVYRNTRRPCYVSNRDHCCRVREF